MGNLPHVLLIWETFKRSHHRGSRKKQLVAQVFVKEKRTEGVKKELWNLSKRAHSFIFTSCLSVRKWAETLPPVSLYPDCLRFSPEMIPSEFHSHLHTSLPWGYWPSNPPRLILDEKLKHLAPSAQIRMKGNSLKTHSSAAEVFADQLWKLQLALNLSVKYGILQLVFIFDTRRVKRLFVAGFKPKLLCAPSWSRLYLYPYTDFTITSHDTNTQISVKSIRGYGSMRGVWKSG